MHSSWVMYRICLLKGLKNTSVSTSATFKILDTENAYATLIWNKTCVTCQSERKCPPVLSLIC